MNVSSSIGVNAHDKHHQWVYRQSQCKGPIVTSYIVTVLLAPTFLTITSLFSSSSHSVDELWSTGPCAYTFILRVYLCFSPGVFLSGTGRTPWSLWPTAVRKNTKCVMLKRKPFAFLNWHRNTVTITQWIKDLLHTHMRTRVSAPEPTYKAGQMWQFSCNPSVLESETGISMASWLPRLVESLSSRFNKRPSLRKCR